MADLTLHLMSARGALDGLEEWLRQSIRAAHAACADRLPLGPLDLAVMAGRRVVPEKGHLGHAVGPGLVFVTVDPDNPALRANADRSLERMVAHELHHAARWDGPGYGDTLGAALVSEGLAGRFAREVWGDVPEPWEDLPAELVRAHLAQADAAWDARGYDHGAWFFGTGTLPRWLGYSMGYRLVCRHLEARPGTSAASLAHVAADAFRPALAAL
ncbi:peptidase [Rhodobacteraceae bacterium CCMM004]|nr:peptidase [Rhodobacteraceae bacterium CCMM004]